MVRLIHGTIFYNNKNDSTKFQYFKLNYLNTNENSHINH